MNKCRFCDGDSRYPLVKYGPRHWAHADCAMRKSGASFFAKLTPYQLQEFPVMAARAAGIGAALSAEIASRPYRPRYVSPLAVDHA